MNGPRTPGVAYPLLGEPVVVEFINTFYVDPDGVTDFLATVDLARGWFRVLEPSILDDVATIDDIALSRIVELRSAIRTLFAARPTTGFAAAAKIIESAVNARPGQIHLTRDDNGAIESRRIHDVALWADAAGRLAHDAISIAATPTNGLVLVCDRPACNMRYFQQHRRRRYCNPACANSDRQRRFQQRTRTENTNE